MDGPQGFSDVILVRITSNMAILIKFLGIFLWCSLQCRQGRLHLRSAALRCRRGGASHLQRTVDQSGRRRSGNRLQRRRRQRLPNQRFGAAPPSDRSNGRRVAATRRRPAPGRRLHATAAAGRRRRAGAPDVPASRGMRDVRGGAGRPPVWRGRWHSGGAAVRAAGGPGVATRTGPFGAGAGAVGDAAAGRVLGRFCGRVSGEFWGDNAAELIHARG